MNRSLAPSRSGRISFTRSVARGFSIVEIMVGLTIGLFLVGVASAVFVGSRQSLKVQDNSAHMQESARALIEDITREVRKAAGFGCFQRKEGADFMTTATLPTGSGGAFPMPPVGPAYFVHGGDATSLVLPGVSGVTPLSGSDYLSVQYGQPVANYVDATPFGVQSNISNPFGLNHPLTVAAGQPMVISDCSSMLVFRVDDTGTVSVLNHLIGGANNVLPADIVGNDPLLSGNPYRTGSTIMWFEAPVFFLGKDGMGRQSLYRWDTTNGGGVQPMVPNVEQMRVLFGVDAASEANHWNSVTVWLDAAAVDAAKQWEKVMAIQTHLVIKSDDEAAIDPMNFTWSSSLKSFQKNALASDRYVRQVYTITASLRNRTPLIN